MGRVMQIAAFSHAEVKYATGGDNIAYEITQSVRTARFRLRTRRYQQLGNSAKNPSILGFIVKHMLLSAICDFGCPLASEGLELGDSFVGSAPILWFSCDYSVLRPPAYGKSPRTQLFIPGSHRCKFIDGVLVHWNVEAKSVTIAPLQITIAASHSPSDTLFMENNWAGMVHFLSQW